MESVDTTPWNVCVQRSAVRSVVVAARSLVPFATCMSLLRVVGAPHNTSRRMYRGRAGRTQGTHAPHAGHITAAARRVLSGIWTPGCLCARVRVGR